MKWTILCFFLSSLLYAQADAITVTASKTVDLAPEEVIFNVSVLADQDASLEQVLQAIKDSGITATNLAGIGTSQFGPRPDQARLSYQFALTTPFAKFKEVLDKFAAVRRSLLAGNTSMELQTYAISVAASDAAREQARQRALPDLIADARRKGESLANAAGVSLGPIQGLSDYSTPAAGFITSGPFGPATLRTTFSLSVRFAVR